VATGKTHDRINLIVGAILCGSLLGLGQHKYVTASFAVGWLISTLIFSPDTDILPKARTGPLRFFLYPYSVFFKHRGLSHSLLFGTITRFVYGFLMLGGLLYVLHEMNKISFSAKDYFSVLYYWLKAYNYDYIQYQMLTWLFGGAFLADLCHIFTDVISSFFKKLIFWR
jgi:uncharacterized metal-binding protein